MKAATRSFVHLVLTTVIATAFTIHAQISQNTWVFGTLNPEPIRYSGSWGYVTEAGEEFALLGANMGTYIISIDDSSNIHEVGFVPGPESNWREIVALGDYAYVSSEGSGDLAGLQILYLGDLPDSVSLETTYTETFSRAHIVQRDIFSEDSYIYVMGTSTNGGIHILDVSDPVQPIDVATYSPAYIHDAHIRGDRAYASTVTSGFTDIVDISDKENPQFLARIDHPQNADHSSFTTPDENYLILCHEQDGTTAKVWDIRDLENIELVYEWTANLASLVHNPYGLGDLVIFSHNTEGFRILDFADPSLPVEVGFYDTWGGYSGGFNGLWSAWPYFPSGKIIGGNRHDGLYVIKFNDTRAARLYGVVTDAYSGLPIEGASITLSEEEVESGPEGEFKIGVLPGTYSLIIEADGYDPFIVDDYMLNSGDSLWLDAALQTMTSIDATTSSTPEQFQLLQNYPNPFNPSTIISLQLAVPSEVMLNIYDVHGRQIRELVNGFVGAGLHEVVWDGTDDVGQAVVSGVYFYRVNIPPDSPLRRGAGGDVLTRKMILMR